MLRRSGVSVDFFQFFDRLNATPKREQDLDCRKKDLEMIVFSGAYSAEQGAPTHVSL
jgi:hypothetical protein